MNAMNAVTLSVRALLVAIYSAACPLLAKADPALSHLDLHANQYTQELIDLVNIPSISSLPGRSRQLLTGRCTDSSCGVFTLWQDV